VPRVPEGDTSPGVTVGVTIASRDGTHIGTVKAVRGERFLVEVRWAFDYWLSTRCVAEVRAGQVILAVDKGDVSDYLIDGDGVDFG
jgi:hypothetical protein